MINSKLETMKKLDEEAINLREDLMQILIDQESYIFRYSTENFDII